MSRQHALGNADIGDRRPVRKQPPRQQQMAGLLRKNVTVCDALTATPHDRAGGAVDAARQIDRDDRGRLRVHASIIARGSALDRPIEAGAEQRIDDDVRAPQALPGSAGISRTGPALGSQRSIALEPRRARRRSSTGPRSRARRAGARQQSRRRRCCPARPPRRPGRRLG